MITSHLGMSQLGGSRRATTLQYSKIVSSAANDFAVLLNGFPYCKRFGCTAKPFAVQQSIWLCG